VETKNLSYWTVINAIKELQKDEYIGIYWHYCAALILVPSSSSSSTNFIATQVLNKISGPLCVSYYTTAVMSMLLWPIVCVAV